MRAFLVLPLLLFIATPSRAAAETRSLELTVTHIADGDTLSAIDVNKIPYRLRLAGIDAPERRQAFSERSRQNLARLVHDKRVRVEWSKRDRYGRLVVKVIVDDATHCAGDPCAPQPLDVNLAQVKAGLAWHYTQFAAEQSAADRRSYASAQAEARSSRTGLWSDATPVPPWDWRHGDATGPVKKSRSGICRDASMTGYESVKHYDSFDSIDACLSTGGRLPKN